MVATTLKRAGFGFLLGMIVGVLFVVLEGFGNGGALSLPPVFIMATGSEAGALLAHMLVSGAFGAIPMAGVGFYEIESWGMLKQALVHYATYIVAYLVIGGAAGWFPLTLPVIGIIAGSMAVGHAIIWLIMYSRYKAEVNELDLLLDKARQRA